MMAPKLKRNARGGLVCPPPSSPVVPEKLNRSVYSGSTPCPPGECLHRLTDRHWKPELVTVKDALIDRAIQYARDHPR